MKLKISKLSRNVINNSIIISGSARSGTTILGNLIGSFENVEYSFEPPLLVSLFSKIQLIKSDFWKLLFETYLYEELMLGSLAGRTLNTNIKDDSSVYKIKNTSEIKKRLIKSNNKNNLEKIVLKHTLAIKILDMPLLISNFKKYYPKTKVLIIRRGPVDVINSLIQKKWFNERYRNFNSIWPFYNMKGEKIPFWVKKSHIEYWLGLDEINKCAYYYMINNKKILNNVKEYKYESMVSDPKSFAEQLSSDLFFNFGEKTKNIINSIKRQNKNYEKLILNKISEEIKKNITFLKL
jgi:hypothetical protein